MFTISIISYQIQNIIIFYKNESFILFLNKPRKKMPTIALKILTRQSFYLQIQTLRTGSHLIRRTLFIQQFRIEPGSTIIAYHFEIIQFFIQCFSLVT